MLALIKRELYEKKTSLIIMLQCLFMVSAPFLLMLDENADGAISILALLFLPVSYMLLGFGQSTFYEDERKVSAYFWCSTPRGMKGVVAAKYGAVLLSGLLVTTYAVIVDQLVCVIEKESNHIAVIAIALLVIQLFMRSIEMPFVFFLGSRYGNYVKTCILGVVILIIIGYFLFGNVPESFSFESILDYLNRIFGDGKWEKKRNMIIGGAAVIVAVMYYLSYRIACKGYWRGVEEYEN